MKRNAARRRFDRFFTLCAYAAVAVMAFFLLLVVAPVFVNGAGAYVFRGTVEFRKMMLDQFGRGDATAVKAEAERAERARQPVYDALARFEAELEGRTGAEARQLRKAGREVRGLLSELLGPLPGDTPPAMTRSRYGKTRWDQAQKALDKLLYSETWDYSGEAAVKVRTPRAAQFEGTALAPAFARLEDDPEALLSPRLVFYPRFLTDKSIDAHFFGGIGPEVVGTIYLTLGAMLLAVPLGIVAAIYFHEYAKEGPIVSFLRSCVNTLAGVPSVVFGLFGLAFFINTLRLSPGKSVAAGALTLARLVHPPVIRASEEALAAVPRAYREGALALGAGKWRAIATVILPAALPGILTGIVISMGRAAGETAPIIFTAAVSVGVTPALNDVFSSPTPALSWNLYNLATEHEAVDEIRHVQHGMAATLVLIVLALNLAAIHFRAKISSKLKG